MLLVGEFRRLFTCSHKFERVLELNMSYIRKGWTRLIGTLSFIFALVWLINLFDGEGFLPENQTPLSAIFIFVGLGIIGLSVAFRQKIPWNKMFRVTFKFRWIVFLIGLVIQVIVVVYGSSYYGADAGIILNIAQGKVGYLTDSYFLFYPNNLVVLFLYKVFDVLFGHSSVVLMLNLFNILIVDATFIYFTHLAKKILSRIGYAVAFYLFLFAVTVTPYILTPYSDTLVLPFVLMLIDIGIRIMDVNGKVKGLMLSVVFGLVSTITMLIKPSAVIPVFAFFLVLFLFKLQKANFFTIVLILFGFGAGFIATDYASSQVREAQTIVKTDPNQAFPLTHFMMIGVNYYGGYTPEDFQITKSVSGKSAREKLNIEVIKMRLKQRGVDGYLQFLLLKERNNTSSGTYSMGSELWVTKDYQGLKNKKMTADIEKYLYPDGEEVIIYKLWAQIIFVIVAFGVLASSWKSVENRDLLEHRQQLSVLGGILFLLLFEGGRSRYLMQFMPVIILVSSYGYQYIGEKLYVKRNDRSEIN